MALHATIYLVFKSSPAIGQCPMNMNILAPRLGALQKGLRNQDEDHFENGTNGFDYISVIDRHHFLK
jgi:hypothetical protein